MNEPIWETRIVPVEWHTNIKTRELVFVRLKGVTQWWGKNGTGTEATFRNLNNVKPIGQRT